VPPEAGLPASEIAADSVAQGVGGAEGAAGRVDGALELELLEEGVRTRGTATHVRARSVVELLQRDLRRGQMRRERVRHTMTAP
jgi:hypothetical protein